MGTNSGDTLGKTDQYRVTDLMSVFVVYKLEVVQIEIEYPSFGVGAWFRKRLLNKGLELMSVRYLG